MYSCLITTVLSTLRSFPLCKTRLWRLSESTLAAAFFMAMRLHCYNGEISPISHIQTPVWSGTGWQWAEIVLVSQTLSEPLFRGEKRFFFIVYITWHRCDLAAFLEAVTTVAPRPSALYREPVESSIVENQQQIQSWNPGILLFYQIHHWYLQKQP